MKPCNHPTCSNGVCRREQKQVKRVPLKKVSDKLKKAKLQYAKIAKQYLRDNPLCMARLEGCSHHASEVHHKRGRIGVLLTDETHFLAVCRTCHQQIETQPDMAKALKLSESRLNKRA